jgi:hypothetical protein
MATGLQSWSKTASSNASADSSVNWAEGMAPSAINNSARAEMASAAMWRDDNAGMITTGGTSTAFTATSNQTLTLADGVSITLQMSATSGATPTLNVDSTGAKPIQSLSGTAIPTGALRQGGLYQFTYRSSPDAWIAIGNPGQEFASGTAMVFYQNTAPTGWAIVTSNTDDRALRIVSGSGAGGGTGGALAGTTAFTSVFAARTLAANQLPNMTLTVTDPGHTHTYEKGSYTSGPGGSGTTRDATGQTGTTSSDTTDITVAIDNTSRGSVAQQTIDFAVKYASCVICTKS